MISDQVGDLLTRIRNATMVEHSTCKTSYSNLKKEVISVLKEEGFIVDYKIQKEEGSDFKKTLVIELKYKNHNSVIQMIKRISKPGLRIYKRCRDLPVVLNHLGIAIVSTSKGIMTAKQAKNDKLGGEVLAHVW